MPATNWTYDPNLTTNRDKVRSLIGDIDERERLVPDETIAAYLTRFSDNVYYAAAAVCRSLAAWYSRRSNMQIDGFRIDWSSRAKAFRDLALQLVQDASESDPGGLGTPYLGGVSLGTMDSIDDDDDRMPSIFKVNPDLLSSTRNEGG